jgi:predicted amidohydrolase
MSVIHVASIAPRMALAGPERNMETLARWSRAASEAGADLALFPELFIPGFVEPFMYEAGYADRQKFLSSAEPVSGPTVERLAALSRELRIRICTGLLELDGDTRYNTHVMVDPVKGYAGGYRKVQLEAGERWFSTPGNDFPIFDVLGIPTGVMICRDKSHPEVARILALEGAQLILVPHATTVRINMGFCSWSMKICAVRAMENGCYVIADNCIHDCPMNEERHQAGYNFAIDPYGEVIHCDEGEGDVEKMALIRVDSAKVRERREWEGRGFNLWSRRPEAYQRLVQKPGAPPDRPEAYAT